MRNQWDSQLVATDGRDARERSRSISLVFDAASLTGTADALVEASRREGIDVDVISRYCHLNEMVAGLGYGGSESLTMFLHRADAELFVRKVLSERLVTPRWPRDGRDVMSPPCVKAKGQIEYLQSLPETVRPLFPEVLDVMERRQIIRGDVGDVLYEFIYDMTYVPGIEVSRFVREYQPSPKVVAALYGEIFRLLRDKVHVHRRRKPLRPTLEQSYFSKIEKRLALSRATAPRTFCDALLEANDIVIDGRAMRNVPSLLATFRETPEFLRILEPPFHSLVVGDTNTENIKIGDIQPLLDCGDDFSLDAPPFTAEELQIRFLDPRAIGFYELGIDTGADDPMYDNKPWHNCLGNYDKIHGEHFDLDYRLRNRVPHLSLSFHERNPYERSYRGIDAYFSQVMKTAWRLDVPEFEYLNDRHWIVRFVFMMGTHFMAMPPFHFSREADGRLVDDASHQRRPLAIYAEGIKWLNLALDMLEGRVSQFLDFPVPAPNARGLR